MENKEEKVKKLIELIEEILNEETKPQKTETTKPDDAKKKISDEEKKELVAAVSDIMKKENPAIVILVSENGEGDLEHSAIYMRGMGDSVAAMLTLSVREALRKLKFPLKLFSEILNEWEIKREQKKK